MGLGPLPPAANILRAAFTGLKSLEPWANILNFAWSGATPTISTLTTIAGLMVDAWEGHVSLNQTHDTAFNGIKLTDMTSPSGAQVELNNFTFAGLNGEDPLPSSVAVLVDYPVNLRYRGGHPRSYVVAGGDGDLSPGAGNWNVWNNAFLANFATDWANFITTCEGLSSGGTNIDHLKCVRYHHNGAYIIPPLQLDLEGFTVSEQVASQRRRVGRSK